MSKFEKGMKVEVRLGEPRYDELKDMILTVKSVVDDLGVEIRVEENIEPFEDGDEYWFEEEELDIIEPLKIKQIDKHLSKIEGDITNEWYDLRVSNIKSIDGIKSDEEDLDILRLSESIKYYKGQVLLLGLGIAIEPPVGYEAHMLPRSSTFKNTGFILTNSMGIIDNTYRGELMTMVYCTRDGILNYNDRLFQMRLEKQQPKIPLVYSEELSETERGQGGYGSTGVK